MLNQLVQQRCHLQNTIAHIRSALAEGNGEAYQGCWLDSAKNSAGQSYTRLRWFTRLQPKKKGCRMLKGEEVGMATKAIALWAELGQATASLNQVEAEIQVIKRQAAAWGLKVD